MNELFETPTSQPPPLTLARQQLAKAKAFSKVLILDVSRPQVSELYVRVPDDINPRDVMRWPMARILAACDATIEDSEWETDDSEVEINGVRVAKEGELEGYEIANPLEDEARKRVYELERDALGKGA